MTTTFVEKPSFIKTPATFFKNEKAKVYGWAYEGANKKPCVIIYAGKSKKNRGHHQFMTAEKRADYVGRVIKSHVERIKQQEEYRAEMNKPSELKVGDILNTCWGYEQTNVEFYIVKKCIGKRTVELCEIAIEEYRADSSMSGKVFPDAFKDVGKPFKRKVTHGQRVKITSSASATPWDGKYVHTSSYH